MNESENESDEIQTDNPITDEDDNDPVVAEDPQSTEGDYPIFPLFEPSCGSAEICS
jgi:hypothetical protein